jgi:uncharacterized membrane protein YgcG
MREFGYPDVNAENIITDQVYSMFFDSMLKDNLGHGVDKAIESLRSEIAAARKAVEHTATTNNSAKPKPRKRNKGA